jgi:hypothetical protein
VVVFYQSETEIYFLLESGYLPAAKTFCPGDVVGVQYGVDRLHRADDQAGKKNLKYFILYVTYIVKHFLNLILCVKFMTYGF